MSDERIKCFIKRIEEIVGPCTYDEKDIEYGTLELYADKYCDMGIEIDTETLAISLFATFSYNDFSKTDLVNDIYEVEELEREISTRLLESSFILYLKSHSPNYIVSIWDDGCFMCPGYVARVGFSNEDFTDALVKEFLDLYLNFWSTIAQFSNFEIRKYIFKSICHNYSIKLTENEKVFFENATLKFGDNQNAPNNNVECYYIGKEKFLFYVAGKCYASDVCPIKIFLEAHDMCELYGDVIFSLDSPPLFDSPVLRAISPHMELSIQVRLDKDHFYTQNEEAAAIMSYIGIVPFASKQFREAFYATYSRMIGLNSGPEPLIITEGSTDWKHLKKYWEQYMQDSLKVKFHEYEPVNSPIKAQYKQEMGSSTLLEMCKAFSKLPLEKVFIFIADADESKIVKEMGGGNKKYKDWGNNVYSFVLPVPSYRETTPEICIEHYYSDEEIKMSYMCTDGRKRRLFLGKDFDKYGRDVDDGLMCIKRNLCGPGSIKIIDASSDTKVISMNEENDINYALSKQDFAAFSTIEKDSQTYYAFREIFTIIQSIINDSQKNDS